MPEEAKGSDGSWVSRYKIYWCMGYNTKLVRSEDLPKRWEDLVTNPKGKIKRLFRFIQREFVMEHLDPTSLETINKTFGRWMEDYNFRHEHKRLDKYCLIARNY